MNRREFITLLGGAAAVFRIVKKCSRGHLENVG
jgi:hypothetical protein